MFAGVCLISYISQIDYGTNYNNLLTNFLHSSLSLTSSSRHCFSLWVSLSILLRYVILRPLPCFPPVFGKSKNSKSKIWVTGCGYEHPVPGLVGGNGDVIADLGLIIEVARSVKTWNEFTIIHLTDFFNKDRWLFPRQRDKISL